MRRPLKAWVLLGDRAPEDLRAQDYVGDWQKVPVAMNFKVGQWLEWRPTKTESVFLVCIEVPV